MTKEARFFRSFYGLLEVVESFGNEATKLFIRRLNKSFHFELVENTSWSIISELIAQFDGMKKDILDARYNCELLDMPAYDRFNIEEILKRGGINITPLTFYNNMLSL